MVEINLSPDEKTLRSFGFIALAGFGVLALLAYKEWAIFAVGLGELRVPVAIGLAALGVVSALVSLVYPRANRPLFVGLSILAFPIGFVLSYIIMGTLFFLVIAPIGLMMRLLGHDPMHRKTDDDADSYWSPARPARPAADYFKQF